MEKGVLVSVCMITYNHEKYIEQAIHGILMQETNFEIELIISNDCSPDNTDSIIQNILKIHPRSSFIKYIKHSKNLGMMPNFIFALKEAKSKYIALCDGDDYWTDPLKLQKQVDFLERNSDCNLVFHGVNELKDGLILEKNLKKKVDSNKHYFKDFLTEKFNPKTCSIVFRKNILKPIIEKNIKAWDYTLCALCYFNSYAYYLNENMGVYRIHENGMASGMKSYEYEYFRLEQYNSLLNYLKPKEEYKLIYKKINTTNFRISAYEFKIKNYSKAFQIYLKAFIKLKHGVDHFKYVLFLPTLIILGFTPRKISDLLTKKFNIKSVLFH
jgi:glycosyltransferase involved in cell wall biosynthesis